MFYLWSHLKVRSIDSGREIRILKISKRQIFMTYWLERNDIQKCEVRCAGGIEQHGRIATEGCSPGCAGPGG